MITPAQAVKLFEAVSKCDGSFRVLRDIRIGKARALNAARPRPRGARWGRNYD
jgi:hypothetical protein